MIREDTMAVTLGRIAKAQELLWRAYDTVMASTDQDVNGCRYQIGRAIDWLEAREEEIKEAMD